MDRIYKVLMTADYSRRGLRARNFYELPESFATILIRDGYANLDSIIEPPEPELKIEAATIEPEIETATVNETPARRGPGRPSKHRK